MKNTHHDSEFYSFEKIQQYLQKELSAEEMHEMEKQMLNDPFLQDAVDGWEQVEDIKNREALMSEIKGQIPSQSKPSTQVILWRSVTTIAATISLVLVVSYFLNQNSKLEATQAFEESTNMSTPEKVMRQRTEEKSIASKDESLPPTIAEQRESEVSDNIIANEAPAYVREEKQPPQVPVVEEVPTENVIAIADDDFELEEIVFEEDLDISESTSGDIAAINTEANKPKSNTRIIRTVPDSINQLSESAKLENYVNSKKAKANKETENLSMSLVEESDEEEPPLEPNANGLNAQQRKPYAPNPYQLYNLEKYNEAAPLLEEVLRKSPSDQVVLYLLSVSYLEVGQNERAIEKLSSLKKKQFKGFKPNQVISLIKEGKQDEALQQLKKYILVNKELILKQKR